MSKKTNVFRIGSDKLILEYDVGTGRLTCRTSKCPLFRNAHMAYVDGDGKVVRATDPVYKRSASRRNLDTAWGTVIALEGVAKAPGLPTLKWTIYPLGEERAVAFEAEVINEGEEDLYVREVYALSITSEEGGELRMSIAPVFFGAPYWKTGYERDKNGQYRKELCNVRLRSLDEQSWVRCWWTLTMAASSEGGCGLMAGVLESANVEVAVLVKAAAEGLGELIISGGCYLDPAFAPIWYEEYTGPALERRPLKISPKRSFKMSATTLMWDDDVFHCMERYGKVLKTFNHVIPLPKPLSGLFLPYSFDKNNNWFGEATEEDCIDWMNYLDETGLRIHGAEYFWMEFGGPASPNLFNPYLMNTFTRYEIRGYRVKKYFPEGLTAFVSMAHSRGYKICWSTRSFMYVKAGASDEDEIVEELYRNAREWGIDYIILDFHFDFKENLSWKRPAMEIYRNRYRTVRKVVGKDIVIEACGVPFGVVLGLADIFRPSGDWVPGRDAENLAGFKSMYYLNGKCFWNTPEYFDVSEIDRRNPNLPYSFERTRAWLSLLGTMCLCTFVGGYLPKHATQERVNLYRKVLPPYPGTARPVDLFENDLPRIYDLIVEKPFGRWHVVGLFNWLEKDTQTVKLDLKRIGLGNGKVLVFDFWEEKFLGLKNGSFSLDILPKDCKILSLRKETNIPTVLSTDRHITQGGVELEQLNWQQKETTLKGTSTGPEDTCHNLFIYVPSGFQPKEAKGCEIISYKPPILKLRVEFKVNKSQSWKMKFSAENPL